MALLLEALPLHPVLPALSERTEEIVLHVRAAHPPRAPRPRLSVVLVLDISASMNGEPLHHVVRSVERLLEILPPEDKLAIVAFDQAARTVVALRKLSTENRLFARDQVRRLRSGRGTNISAGLSHAALLFPPRGDHERQLLCLLSDGQPSVGSTSQKTLAKEAGLIRARGVAVSTLGYGRHHAEDMLLQIADAGGGRYAFIPDPLVAGTSFARAVGTQLDIVAEDVQLLLTPAAGVEIRHIFGDPQVTVVAGGLRLPLQDLVDGEERHVVLSLHLSTPKLDGANLHVALRAELSARAAGAAVTCHDQVSFTLVAGADGAGANPAGAGANPAGAGAANTAGAGADAAEVDVRALVPVLIARAEERRAEGRALADRGDFAGAAALLRGAREGLIQAAGQHGITTGPLTVMIALLTDEIVVMDRRPGAEAYKQHRQATLDAPGPLGSVRAAGTNPYSALPPRAKEMVKQTMVGGSSARLELVVLQGPEPGRVYALTQPEADIGRTEDNDIAIPDETVSRHHARLVYKDGAFHILDLASTYGLLVNGRPVTTQALKGGDIVQVGQVRLLFRR